MTRRVYLLTLFLLACGAMLSHVANADIAPSAGRQDRPPARPNDGRLVADTAPGYDKSPTRVLFMIDTKGGYASQLQELTALPEFVLYGDGTAVWTRYDKKKDLRLLMAARLSSDEVDQLLSYLQSLGYDNWYERYDGSGLVNLPTTTMLLNLKDKLERRTVYGLALALKQNSIPEGFGEIYDHFTHFKHKDEYEYPIDRVMLFARRLTKTEARRGARTLNWGIKQIKLEDFAHEGESDYGQKVVDGADADRVVSRLRDWTMFSTDLSVIFFKEKKGDYQVGYRPLLPHE